MVALPESAIVDFKEALVFAYLGVRRLRGEPTALGSGGVAARDGVGGAVYLG
jgi:anhydro-N-acetylmuramic acid kinase